MMSSDNNPFAEFITQNDFSKLLENYQQAPVDMETLLETNRKNLQALTEAQQTALENLQTIANRQSEILSQMVEDNSTIAKEMMVEGTPEEKMAKNAEIFKKVYENSIKNMKELSEMVNKSNDKTSAIINKRVFATMNEIKSSLEKAPKKAA